MKRLMVFLRLLTWSAWKVARLSGVSWVVYLGFSWQQGTLDRAWLYALVGFAGGVGVCMPLTLEHAKNGSWVD